MEAREKIDYKQLYKVFYEMPGKPMWEKACTIEEIADAIGLEIPMDKAQAQYLLNRLRQAVYQFRNNILDDSNHFLISMKLEKGALKVYLVTRKYEKIEVFTNGLKSRKRHLEQRINELKHYEQTLLPFAKSKSIR